MNSIATRHFDEHESTIVEFPTMHGNAQCRFDGIGADLHQQAVEGFHLFPGHAVNPPVVRHALRQARRHASALLHATRSPRGGRRRGCWYPSRPYGTIVVGNGLTRYQRH